MAQHAVLVAQGVTLRYVQKDGALQHMAGRETPVDSQRDFLTAPCFKGHAVAQLVEALPYKPEGRGFDSQLCHLNFSLK